MKNIYLFLVFFFTTTAVFAQDRVNATAPKINRIAKGKLTEAVGWLQNDAGKWVSRKNKIPANIEEEYKSLIDFESDGLGEERENFIYYEVRDITINDSVYGILIKKFKDGYYKYESINKGWMPQTSISYGIFRWSELDKVKNMEEDKVQIIKINLLYNNTDSYLDPNYSLGTIEQEVSKLVRSKDKPLFKEDLYIAMQKYKGNVRFMINLMTSYSTPIDFEKSYYETSAENFGKLFVLK